MVLPNNDLPEPDNSGDDGGGLSAVPAYLTRIRRATRRNLRRSKRPLQGLMALPEAPSEWWPTEEMLRPAEPRRVEPLGQAQIQAIQAAMAGFELPSSHLPPWAKDVPEEEWKQCLYRKLKGLEAQQS
ncbi:hypothetical protein MRX96_033731 [Rhipicephalus microplus]